MEFASSERSTLGVEVEYGAVDVETGVLVACSNEILAEMGEGHPDGIHPKAKHELFQSSIEVITGICETADEAVADLRGTLDELQPHLDAHHVALQSAGTHPFTTWSDLQISPSERYHDLVQRIQWPARRLTIHGTHVHVGIRSPEKAIATVNALTTYLPHLLALSSSSPYWHGQDTGMASVRTKIFEVMPTAGLPPRLDDWAEFEAFLDALIRAGSIESVREVWWDIRPHPGFGTVELRMCDGIPTLEEVGVVAALAQCLVTRFDRLMDEGKELPILPTWAVRENKWRASRWGVDASIITSFDGTCRPMRDLLLELAEDLGPEAEQLGCTTQMELVPLLLDRGPSYVRQREVVARGGNLADVVLSLVAELRDGPGI